MLKDFNLDFQTQLWETIANIEQQSQVEVVVVIRERASDYTDIPLYWGLVGGWLAHSCLIFVPTLFSDLTIYLGPLIAFMLAWIIGGRPSLQRLCLSEKRRKKTVEIMARALFQKGGIYHTKTHIGILIYCSLLEKSVFVLPDRGAELAVPTEEWHSLQTRLQHIFKAEKPSTALLTTLVQSQSLFVRYLPALNGDINELPDNLNITL